MPVGTLEKIYLEIDRRDFGKYTLRHGKDQAGLSFAFRKGSMKGRWLCGADVFRKGSRIGPLLLRRERRIGTFEGFETNRYSNSTVALVSLIRQH